MSRFAFFFALLFSTSSVFAQFQICNTEACANQNYLNPARLTISKIMEKFKPYIEETVPFLYEQGAVRVRAYADFNAFVDYDNEEIILPAQFVIESYFSAQAAARASVNPKMQGKMIEYNQYLVERSEKVRRKGGIDEGTVLNYSAFIGESQSDYEKQWTSQVAGRYAGFFVDSLAAVLAHEIGHHALKHKRGDKITPTQSRAQERAADTFAIKLLIKAGYDPAAPGLTTMTRFALREKQFGSGDFNTRTHPLSECRMYAFTNASIQSQFRSGDVPAGIDINKARRDWDALRQHCETDDK